MTPEKLTERLRATAGTDPERRAAIERLLAAATPCADFDEIVRELPAKARYIGPGPWLDAIRATFKGGVQGRS